MDAYEKALERCSTPWAPWYVIPANQKWYRNHLVARLLRKTLEDLDLKYPPGPPGLAKVKISK
jgi:polyphosphate kinase 2 (PPK2 family)